jgi:hypothetical protein
VEVVGDGQLLACDLIVTHTSSCRDENALFVRALPYDKSGKLDRLQIELPSSPKELAVTIFRDDLEIGHQSYAPEYHHVVVGSGECRRECWKSPDLQLVIAN